MPAPDDAGAIGELWEARGWPTTRDFHELLVEMGSELSWSKTVHRIREYCDPLSITDYRAKYAEPADDKPPKDTSERHAVREDEAGAVAWSIGQRITTIEQLEEVCEIDLNYWERDRLVANKWEMGRRKETKHLTFTDGKIDGEIHDDGELTKGELLQLKGFYKRREVQPFEAAFEALLDTVRERAPAVLALPRGDGEHLFVPAFADPHIGALSMDGEYTLAAAERAFDTAGDAMITRVRGLGMRIGEIAVQPGNDTLHVDNLHSTTSSGTWVQQAADARDAIKVACRTWTHLILKLAELAPVRVIPIPGNHDELGAFWLGMYLEARFHNDKRVTVDTSKRPHKYHRYGKVLLGFAHGKNIKPQDLALLMADDVPEDWAASTYREWITAHFHTARRMIYLTSENRGVNVRTLPGMAPPDNWHVSQAFTGNHRAATALLYHHDYGPAGEFPVFVEPAARPAVARAA